MTPKPVLLTTAEAAPLLGISTNTLIRWAKDGRIAHVRLPSNRLRFPQSAIDDALAVRPASLARTA